MATEKFQQHLSYNWQIFSSSQNDQSGEIISQSGFVAMEPFPTSIPKTVMAALVENGEYENIFFAKNLEKVDQSIFQTSWWYRKTFDFDEKDFQHIKLVFEGINYKANIWLNGTQIGKSEDVEQPFRIFEFDITNLLKDKDNVIAVEIIPPVSGDLTIGFVDWNPWPPDNNMGIWRPVKLVYSKAISLNNTFVQTEVNTTTLDEADIIINTTVKNHSPNSQKFTIEGNIGEITLSKEITLKSGQEVDVNFCSRDFPQLNIKNPKLWWPNGLGDQPLFNLELSAKIKNVVSDIENIQFGIRKFDAYINNHGHKQYTVNGKNILIKSAGWVDDMFLNDSDKKVRDQLAYVKHINLNSVRLEGFWGKNKTIYETCDELGLLLMIGWSCHWEWEGYCGRPETQYLSIHTPEDIAMHTDAYIDQVKWGRNHASIFTWVFGSDKLLRPEFEKSLTQAIKKEDPTRPILSTCKMMDYDVAYKMENSWNYDDVADYPDFDGFPNNPNYSEVSGCPGVKMTGPYAYTPPKYWYENRKLGGAYGFNTETGPGAQVPPLESLKKMLPEDKLWPVTNDVFHFHNGRNEFQTLNRFLNAFNKKYGEFDNIEGFATYCQLSNYETMRPMYEAFQVNRPIATGIVQWMLNSAWPETFWQLYDWYMMPNGAFYGALHGCEPVNLVFNYDDRNIYAINEKFYTIEGMKAEIKVLDINSNIFFEKEIKFNLPANESSLVFDMPEIQGLTKTYFLSLKLKDADGDLITDNFYWLSTQEAELDYKNSVWFFTPMTQYEDFTALQTMEKVKINSRHKFTKTNDGLELTVTYENPTNKIAFFIESRVIDKKSGLSILPVFFSDNYITLLPRETKTITAKINGADLEGKNPVFEFSGINIK
ncbi:MAG: beta galactosidase jelly roll domain-containing protein [Candidatus Marinimicrobia bacterium]|nr:beta galactosidase jelly roll domain-containing protein [Candidatus Neomarinimicrobiota bacterium]